MLTYSQLVVADGPAFYLPMQDGKTANGDHPTDLIGAFTPTTQGTFTTSAAGPTINTIVNQAYACAGGAGNQVLVRATPIIRGLTNWTVEMWVKAAGTSPYSFYMERSSLASQQDISAFSSIGGLGQIATLYRDDPGTLTYSLSNGGGGSGSSAGMSISDGLWHYVVGVKAGTQFLNYIDGALGYSYNWTPGSTNTQTEASVPAWLFNDPIINASLAGSMAHAAVYLSALSGATIAAHWANSQAGVSVSGLTVAGPGALLGRVGSR